MNCEYCQSPVHIWFQCPKKPDGWKPARLARVRIGTASSPDRLQTPKSDVSASPPSDVRVHTQSPARLAKKSTGAKARAVTNHHGSQVAQKVEQGDASVIARGSYVAGSIPALPVDTNSDAGSSPKASLTTSAGTVGNKDRQPNSIPVQDAKAMTVNTVATFAPEPAQEAQILRPGPKFDKKAWMKAYMKTYIRQYREDVKSGKRTPKPRA